MRNLTVENIAKAVGGNYFGPENLLSKEISGVTLDSRQVEKDFLFVPVKGERVDGNAFIESAYEKGALLCLREKPEKAKNPKEAEKPERLEETEKLENPEELEKPYILVNSCLTAIRDLAEFYRKQFSIPVIGITGSVGKTSTKEMVASVLSQKYRVLKTQGNFNNEIGLPLTIFGLQEDTEIAVVEMGMSDFVEMERLSKIARPDVCVITNIGPCHLENCGDLDGVLRAKKEIFTYRNPEGAVFLNGDDKKLRTVEEVQPGKVVQEAGTYSIGEKTDVRKGIKPVFFGLSNKNEFYASDLESQGLKGYRAVIHGMDKGEALVIPVQVNTPGIHMVSNAAAAAAIGVHFGLSKEQIARGIAEFATVGDRSNFIETEKYLLFSDCYNANPASVRASINVMKDALGRKVCLLGDMFELGTEEKQLHRQTGAYAAEAGMDVLLFVGQLSEEAFAGAQEAIEKKRAAGIEKERKDADIVLAHFRDLEEAKSRISEYLKKGDTILIKASHGMHFEELTAFLQRL